MSHPQRNEQWSYESLSDHVNETTQAFYTRVEQISEEHSKQSGNEIYTKRSIVQMELSDVCLGLESTLSALRCLLLSASMLPSRELEAQLKEFARTRTFRSLAQTTFMVAERINTIEDLWNDMAPSQAAVVPQTPVVQQPSDDSFPNPLVRKRKGVC